MCNQQEQILEELSNCFKPIILSIKKRLIREEVTTIHEAVDMEKAFIHLSWTEIDSKVLLKHKASLNYFSDSAFIRYLPAFMKLIISDIEGADVLIDILIEKLKLPTDADTARIYINYLKNENNLVDLQDYYETELSNINGKIHEFIKRYALLSQCQSQCVLLFLDYLKKYYSNYCDAEMLSLAIYRYWFVFHNNQQ